jgi:hypothetical protein
MAGCWQLGMATTTLPLNTQAVSGPIACQEHCHQKTSCKFFQWNHSKKECKLLYSDIKEIYKDTESLLGDPDCNNYASLWKKQLIAPPTPTPPTPTATTKRTRTASSTTSSSSWIEASVATETGGILTPQNSTSTRYT